MSTQAAIVVAASIIAVAVILAVLLMIPETRCFITGHEWVKAYSGEMICASY